MQYMLKRIIAIILSLAVVVFSILRMKNFDSSSNLLPAVIFSLGLVVTLESIKRILLGLASRTATKSSLKR